MNVKVDILEVVRQVSRSQADSVREYISVRLFVQLVEAFIVSEELDNGPENNDQ